MRTAYTLYELPPDGSVAQRRPEQFPDIDAAQRTAGYPDAAHWTMAPSGVWTLTAAALEQAGLPRSPWVIEPVDVPETDADRVKLAIKLAVEYGGFDGAHHKTWVIDQMVRLLAGDSYEQIVAEACDGEDGPDTYSWDEGIAP